MNRLGKTVLLFASMMTMEYVAHAQVDTYHVGEGTGINGGESSVSRFALYYRNDSSEIEEEYLDNAVQLAEIHRYFDSPLRIDSITIYAYTSPEGVYEHNVLLSKRRAIAARDYILRHFSASNDLTADKIILRPMEENWFGLYDTLVRDYHRDDRERVLAILESDVRNDTKKWRLEQLDNGNTYKYIIRNIMPRLRMAAWICVWTTPVQDGVLCEADVLPEPARAAALVKRPPAMPLAPLYTTAEQPKPKTKHTILGLKTNMLYDVATVLNFSVEAVISRRFSILYEQHCPWWLTDNNRYCLQMLSFGGEFRWWFKPTTGKYASRTDWVRRDALVGHFLGLYGFAGDFDVQAKRKGCYQGEFVSVGLTYGYAMPISKRLNLEFSISVGYANIPYRHYIPTDDYEFLMRDPNNEGRTHYIGPTRIGISLVVPILASGKAKGGRR